MNQPDEMSQLDEACSRFELAWSATAQPPDLRAFLDSSEKHNPGSLFRLLLPIDIEQRRKRSIDIDAGFYREQFPEYGMIIDSELGQVDNDSPDTVTLNEDSSIDVERDFSADMPDTVDFVQPQKAIWQGNPIRKQIGRYTILSQLGGGGQGNVFRAAHPTLPIEVAIKIGNRQLDDDARQAMIEEAQVLCELDHPGIAKIRDLDFDDHGCPILVLELVRGRSLANILKEGKVSQEKMIKWLLMAADALDYAHRRGVLHLDLKPGNIVITETDEAKVIDFGLARSRDAWSDVSDEDDHISGTPEYMPPEQAEGIAEKITSRSDVFALGAILYRFLTGAAPFHAENSIKALYRSRDYDLDLEVLSTSSTADPLIEICRRSIERDPAERYHSAKEFASSLRGLATKTISIDPAASHGDASVRPDRPNWIPWVVSIVCVIAMIVGLSWALDPGTSLLEESTSHSPAVPTAQMDSVTVSDFAIRASRDLDTFYPVDDLAPLRNGDVVRFSVNLDQAAYVRLLWIDAEGALAELYPNDPEQGPREARVKSFESPVEPEGGWPIEGNSGIETALLLVSREPLDQIDLDSLQFNSAGISSNASVSRFHVARSGAVEKDAGDDGTRSLGSTSQKVNDPMLRLLGQLRDQVDVAEAVTVPHAD